MVPVNTNFRYGPDEIVYLFDNADVEAVVFHATFGELLTGVRDRLPAVRRWYVVADDSGPGPEWAVPYEDVAGSAAAAPPVARSGDDLLLLYTGGTTGIPKGVMWRQDDLFNVLGAGSNPFAGTGPAGDTDEVASRAAAADPPPVMVVACPLMHGTGQFSALIAMTGGGTVVLSRRPSLRCRRAVRHGRTPPRQQHRDRRPGLRRADAGPPRRLARAPRPLQRGGDLLVGRDVEPREQAGPAAAHAPGRPLRLLRLVGGGRPRRVRVGRRHRRGDGALRHHREQRSVHRRRATRRDRARARSA